VFIPIVVVVSVGRHPASDSLSKVSTFLKIKIKNQKNGIKSKMGERWDAGQVMVITGMVGGG